MTKVVVSYFDGTRGVEPAEHAYEFADLVDQLRESFDAEFERQHKASALCLVPATFDPPHRAKSNVKLRFAFSGDVDGDRPGDPGFEAFCDGLDALNLQYVAYTTTKSTSAQNRYRVLIPYSEPIAATASEQASAAIDVMLGEVFDTKTFDAPRLSILPYAWKGAPEGASWDDAEAHRGFRANIYGQPLDAMGLLEVMPPAPEPRIMPIVALAPIPGDFDYLLQTDLYRSPLVTQYIRDEYCAAPAGGRLYQFLTRVAARAVRKALPIDAHTLAVLAQRMNDSGPRPQRRTGLIREAQRALTWAQSTQTVDDRSLTVREQKILRELARFTRRNPPEKHCPNEQDRI